MDRQALDRYLTTEPDDGYDGYVEELIDNLPEHFYNAYYQWIEDSSESLALLEDYHSKQIDPKEAAKDLHTRIMTSENSLDPNYSVKVHFQENKIQYTVEKPPPA